MDRFFNPKGVAVIGASSKKGKIGYEVSKNLLNSEFQGNVYLINPKGEDVLGEKSFKSISDVKEEVELAVIILPARFIPDSVEECGMKGVKRVVVISGGFKELGEEGAEIENRVVEIAKKYGIRVIGPNCIGIMNASNNLDTFFQPREAMLRPDKGSVTFLTQSGTFGATFLEWLALEKLGLSKFVSYGNKADVDEVDMLSYLKNDDETKVIALYIEGLSNGREFLKIARDVSMAKPIVVIKAGKTSKGAMAVKSHTGVLAGDDAIFVGAMRQSGIIMVDDLEEMLDVVKILSMQPLPHGGKIGITTNGAGPCVVAVDWIEQFENLNLAELDKDGIETLGEKLPSYCIISNPLDLTGSADAEMYEISLNILALDSNVDILMPFFVFQDAPLVSTIRELHEIMSKIKRYKKTIVCVAGGGEFTMRQRLKLQENSIPVIPTAKRAVVALSKVVGYAKWRAKQSLPEGEFMRSRDSSE